MVEPSCTARAGEVFPQRPAGSDRAALGGRDERAETALRRVRSVQPARVHGPRGTPGPPKWTRLRETPLGLETRP